MSEQTSTPGAETTPSFTWKHALALLFAVGITLTIFAFREQIQRLQALAYLGAFLSMLLGNATLILPVPGLIFVYALGGTLNPLLVGLAAGPGAALGELTGYVAGYGGSGAIEHVRLYAAFERWMARYGLLVVVVLAIVPNPLFDMAGMVAGASKIPWWQFLIAALIGKTIQSILIAYAGAFSLGWVGSMFTH